MESARIETLLDQGWNLIGQLHQWMSNPSADPYQQDDLVDLIAGLQSFWGKSDDLHLKRLARSSLALEQFFERLCAKKLDIAGESLSDLGSGITALEDLLLEFEATGEEPVISHLDSLLRLEKQASLKYSTDVTRTTIEISTGDEPSRIIVSPNPGELVEARSNSSPIVIPPSHFSDDVETQSERKLTSRPKRIECTLLPVLDRKDVTSFEIPAESLRSLVAEKSSPNEEDDLAAQFPEPKAVLILVESLFYRHLIELALQSAGYDVEAIDPADSKAVFSPTAATPTYRALLVTPSAASQRIDQIRQCCERAGTKVIGLKGSDQDEKFPVELDAAVFKSQPQQLISVLDQLLNSPANLSRKIA